MADSRCPLRCYRFIGRAQDLQNGVRPELGMQSGPLAAALALGSCPSVYGRPKDPRSCECRDSSTSRSSKCCRRAYALYLTRDPPSGHAGQGAQKHQAKEESLQVTGALILSCLRSTTFAGSHPVADPVVGPLPCGSWGVEFQDDRVMDHPVNSGRGGHRIGEDVLPLGEDQVGGDAQDRRS